MSDVERRGRPLVNTSVTAAARSPIVALVVGVLFVLGGGVCSRHAAATMRRPLRLGRCRDRRRGECAMHPSGQLVLRVRDRTAS